MHYDGAQFVGWQRQAEGRTVQAEFEAVLERLLGRRTAATGAGRGGQTLVTTGALGGLKPRKPLGVAALKNGPAPVLLGSRM